MSDESKLLLDQIDRMNTFYMWSVGIFIALIIGFIGFLSFMQFRWNEKDKENLRTEIMDRVEKETSQLRLINWVNNDWGIIGVNYNYFRSLSTQWKTAQNGAVSSLALITLMDQLVETQYKYVRQIFQKKDEFPSDAKFDGVKKSLRTHQKVLIDFTLEVIEHELGQGNFVEEILVGASNILRNSYNIENTDFYEESKSLKEEMRQLEKVCDEYRLLTPENYSE